MLQSFFLSRHYLQHRMIFSQKPQTSDMHPQFDSEVVYIPRLAKGINSKNVNLYYVELERGKKVKWLHFKYLNN